MAWKTETADFEVQRLSPTVAAVLHVDGSRKFFWTLPCSLFSALSPLHMLLNFAD